MFAEKLLKRNATFFLHSNVDGTAKSSYDNSSVKFVFVIRDTISIPTPSLMSAIFSNNCYFVTLCFDFASNKEEDVLQTVKEKSWRCYKLFSFYVTIILYVFVQKICDILYLIDLLLIY